MSKNLGFIDFAAVKAAVSLEQILNHYGVLAGLKPHGVGLRGCCPIHKGNDPQQFSVNLPKNAWNCFSQCKHGGNMLEFVMGMEGCTLIEAAWRVNEWFRLGLEAKAAGRPWGKRKEKPADERKAPVTPASAPADETAPAPEVESEAESGENPVLGFSLGNLDSEHPYLAERGLSSETIIEFGLGYCPKGIMAGRIAIPIHNSAGQLVANAGRWPGEPPEGKEKYRLPGKFKKTLELFNLHRAALQPSEDILLVVEGFFGCLSLWQRGYRKAVALMGSHLSERQEKLIAGLVTPASGIILMLDNDEAGNSGSAAAASRLSRLCFVRTLAWPEGAAQPEDLRDETLASLLS